MVDIKFDPEDATADAGQEICWVNEDTIEHNAVDEQGGAFVRAVRQGPDLHDHGRRAGRNRLRLHRAPRHDRDADDQLGPKPEAAQQQQRLLAHRAVLGHEPEVGGDPEGVEERAAAQQMLLLQLRVDDRDTTTKRPVGVTPPIVPWWVPRTLHGAHA